MPTEPPRLASDDAYTEKYMSDGAVVHAEKSVAPRRTWITTALMLPLSVLPYIFFTVYYSFDPMFAVVCALLTLIVGGGWLLNLVLRTTVTATHLHVQHGVFGPTIPLEDIVDCEAFEGDSWRDAITTGFALTPATERFYTVEGQQRAIRVRYRGPKGTHTVIIGSETPERLVAAIERARHATPASAEADANDATTGVVFDTERAGTDAAVEVEEGVYVEESVGR